MNLQFRCGTEVRRQKVLAPESIFNGIDYLEVAPDQLHLQVHFLKDLSGSSVIGMGNVVIEGGVRIKGIRITSVEPSPQAGLVLTLTVAEAGDFSTYTLRLQKVAAGPAPLEGYDQVLSSIDFSFRAACPSDFDCEVDPACVEPSPPVPAIDYLSKDYASFRRLMLDRLAVTATDWTERSPADTLVTLVELLAYVGDDLSYRQDAIASEAYLGTCRRRISMRRHARLLDYRLHEGCNARAWIHFETQAAAIPIPQRTQVISGAPDQGVQVADLARLTDQSFVVFETMHPVTVRQAHNRIRIWTWGDSSCCLPRGATAATLVWTNGMLLAPGEPVLFEEALSPATGHPADADPTHRQVVRLTSAAVYRDELYGVDVVDVEWSAADALTFPLCVSAEITDPTNLSGGMSQLEVGVARANLALADNGLTLAGEPLIPDSVPVEGSYQPMTARNDLTFAVALTAAALTAPAVSVANADPRQALPAIQLSSTAGVWTPNNDLLDSDRFRRELVVEMEDDRTAHMRFGDDVHGLRPTPGDRFSAVYRVGSGSGGNVGREVLRRVVATPGVDLVRNPLPAVGGDEPELLEEVRQLAPQAFRTQERAVTEADYVDIARRHPEVLNAAARMRWTGSWWTVFLTAERRGGLPTDADFSSRVAGFLDQYRLAGYDLEIESPNYIPLDVALLFCPQDGHLSEDVRQAILAALAGRSGLPGQAPFFTPDNFTFGQAVYLSRLYAAVLSVPGVASAVVTRFQRWGKVANKELQNGTIPMASLEVARLANDPNFPENGRLEVALGGAA